MVKPPVPAELLTLRKAIEEFVAERRAWPPERQGQAKREIAEVRALLEQAAAALGLQLPTSDADSSHKKLQ